MSNQIKGEIPRKKDSKKKTQISFLLFNRIRAKNNVRAFRGDSYPSEILADILIINNAVAITVFSWALVLVNYNLTGKGEKGNIDSGSFQLCKFFFFYHLLGLKVLNRGLKILLKKKE